MALAVRPDIVAYRLGIKSAEANVRLQLANRFTDVYVLYQPYTLQDNSPYGLKSPTSWALGVTVPLPVYNRNQGGIARAKLNVTQSQIELASIERQLMTDVQQAVYEYQVTAKMVARIKNELMPAATQVRDDTLRLYQGGEVNVVVFLNAQKEYQDTLKTIPRHRDPPSPIDARPEHRAGATGFALNHRRGDRRRIDPHSVHQDLDDPGEIGAGIGQAVEVVLALATGRDDSAVPEQGQVMADGGLALAQLVAKRADMALALGQGQDDLKPRRIADVLQQDRGATRLLEPLIHGLRSLLGG